MIHYHHLKNTKKQGINIAFWLTFFLFFAEVVGGFLTNSLAIISDAWHLLSDLLALAVSWFALHQAAKPANTRLTYGYHRLGIFAALINNVTLIGISFFIIYSAIHRFFYPIEVKSIGMIFLAALGFIITSIIVFFLKREGQNLNIKSATFHFIGDAYSYVGVVIGGILLYYTNWFWIDPLLSILFASIIFRGAFMMLKETIKILMEAVPEGYDVGEIKTSLEKIPGIHSAHDIHVWGISAEEVMLTAHVVIDDIPVSKGYDILQEAKKMLHVNYDIWHSNFQLEPNLHTTDLRTELG